MEAAAPHTPRVVQPGGGGWALLRCGECGAAVPANLLLPARGTHSHGPCATPGAISGVILLSWGTPSHSRAPSQPPETGMCVGQAVLRLLPEHRRGNSPSQGAQPQPVVLPRQCTGE